MISTHGEPSNFFGLETILNFQAGIDPTRNQHERDPMPKPAMNFTVRLVAVAVSLLSAAAQPAPPAATDPNLAAMYGDWVVRHVAVEEADGPHAAFHPDTPVLKDRVLTVSGDLAVFNGGDNDCPGVTVETRKAFGLGRWIGQRFPSRSNNGKTIAPELHEFGLDIPEQMVIPLILHCTNGSSKGAKADAWNDAVFLSLNDGRMLMSYNGVAVFLLQRVTDTMSLKPSFDCAKAYSATEHSICNSKALSGYDRSVAEAFHQLISLRPDVKDAAKQEQISFLKKRDACGDAMSCISEVMSDRVSELMQEVDGAGVGN